MAACGCANSFQSSALLLDQPKRQDTRVEQFSSSAVQQSSNPAKIGARERPFRSLPAEAIYLLTLIEPNSFFSAALFSAVASLMTELRMYIRLFTIMNTARPW